MLTNSNLVENGTRHYGRFLKTPIANPLDEFSGLKRVFKNLRTKEWAGFDISHPEFHSAMIMQDAKYLKSSTIYIYDVATGEMNEHEAASMDFSLSTDLLHSSPKFQTKNYSLCYEFSDSVAKILIDIAATKTAKAIKAEIVLDAPRKSFPLVVSAKLPQGGTMYTNKLIFPASGFLQVGAKRYDFDAARDLVILDEHKSHLPYNTEWTWGTFAFPTDGNFVGANFAVRPQFPDQEEESCLWSPQGAEPLANITFEKLGKDDNAEWKIQSADGRLDVTFTPLGQKTVKKNFLFAAIDYYQMFGTYRGSIRGANKTWTFENIHGLFEQMKMRS